MNFKLSGIIITTLALILLLTTMPVYAQQEQLKIFVTSNAYSGDLVEHAHLRGAGSSVNTGSQAADYLCSLDSNKPNAAQYKALIGTTTRYAGSNDWVLAANSTYYRTDGAIISVTNANKWFTFDANGRLTNPISTLWNDHVWIGLDPYTGSNVYSNYYSLPLRGTAVANCQQWTSNDNFGTNGTFMYLSHNFRAVYPSSCINDARTSPSPNPAYPGSAYV